MIKIEADTLEAAYKDAASKLECSVTELKIEVVQVPSRGFLGLFKKTAVIVAVQEVKTKVSKQVQMNSSTSNESSKAQDKPQAIKEKVPKTEKESQSKQKVDKREALKPKQREQNKRPKKQKSKIQEEKNDSHTVLNDTIMPASFVSMQDDENEYDVSSYLADYEESEEECEECENISEIAKIVSKEINELFDLTCFKIDTIDVSAHDENTLLVEFKGEDAALLIGKEGYRYKALSYMIFNWLNTKYQVQLRLEIAEFLKNQEESISKYLVGVCENINRDGRAQTKILDGVLVQIALNELRDKYPDKYIVIRSTRDGLKYIIVNDYHSN